METKKSNNLNLGGNRIFFTTGYNHKVQQGPPQVGGTNSKPLKDLEDYFCVRQSQEQKTMAELWQNSTAAKSAARLEKWPQNNV